MIPLFIFLLVFFLKEYSDGELEQTDGAEQTPEEASGVQDAPEQDSSDGSEDVDFSLFGDKKLSLLERCRDKEMTEQVRELLRL